MKELVMQEEQLDLFRTSESEFMEFEDVSDDILAFEDSTLHYDINPDWNDLSVSATYTYDNYGYPEITFEEFQTNVAMPISYDRDWIMWEETKPLTIVGEADILRKEIADLTKSLYKQYERVKELSEENQDLKDKIEQLLNKLTVHNNTRKF